MHYWQRSSEGCLCCGGTNLHTETTIVSPFLAKRAWNGKPELTNLIFCSNCGFRFFDRGLSDEEVSNYCPGLGDDEYVKARHVTPSRSIQQMFAANYRLGPNPATGALD